MKVLLGTRAWAALALLALGGCEQVEQVQDRFREMTPHEAYEAALRQAGLLETALGRDWVRASRDAVAEATPVSLPFQEEGFITPEAPDASGFRVKVGRGQRLSGQVTLVTDEGAHLFVDVFRVPEDEEDPFRPVLSSQSIPGDFAYEPDRGGEFVVRIQPELLRGGTYRVVMRLEAQLAFPVAGYGPRAIQSVWGAERDGGRRRHEGVDIFARRGTPVVATSNGVVNRVDLKPIGGKVVWLRDSPRRANIYYAHLDSQAVVSGQRVHVGDTLGFVGNTGNARTTPPHLHFGIYRSGEGAVNPDPFIRPPGGHLASLDADVRQLGSWVRLRDDGTHLRVGPSRRADVMFDLDDSVSMRVLGGSGDWFRVKLPDGTQGYVAARLTRPVAPDGTDAPARAVAAGGD